MDKIKIWISKTWRFTLRQNPKEFVLLAAIILVAAFCRLYKIDQYMTFLGDEGRDVIIVRRIFTEFHPPLIGPGTSIGNMYLGPLYYYMMAPALLLANFSPVGPAVMIALLGVSTVFFVWLVGREWFGKIAGIVAASLYAISPVIIIYSRSSWNPNIMPFFSLLSIYSIWRVWARREFKWLIVLGISFAFVLQSHYLGLLLLPTLGIFWILTLVKSNKLQLTRVFWINSFLGLLLFIFLMSPLVIFDARHGWHNFGAMKEFFTARQTTVSFRPWNAVPQIYPILENVETRLVGGTNEPVGMGITLLTIFLIVIYLALKFKKKFSIPSSYFFLFSWIGFALLGLGLYKQQIYDHYYGFFFAAPFLLLGAIAQKVVTSDKFKVVRYAFFACYLLIVVVNVNNSPLLKNPTMQLQRAEIVAQKIEQESGGNKFNLAVVAERNYEDGYKYFLLKDGFGVVDIDAQVPSTITDQLFVVCELPKEKCDPVHSPKAEVANFGWSKIDSQWDIFGVTIYKLIHLQK